MTAILDFQPAISVSELRRQFHLGDIRHNNDSCPRCCSHYLHLPLGNCSHDENPSKSKCLAQWRRLFSTVVHTVRVPLSSSSVRLPPQATTRKTACPQRFTANTTPKRFPKLSTPNPIPPSSEYGTCKIFKARLWLRLSVKILQGVKGVPPSLGSSAPSGQRCGGGGPRSSSSSV